MSRFNMQDYDEVYQRFVWEYPEHYNFVSAVIDKWAEESDKLAMLWVDDSGREIKRTFSDIASASKKLCNVLRDLDIQRGETVILMLGRNPEWWEIFTACLRMGAVISPGTTQLSAQDLSYRIKAAQATCLITDAANAGRLEQAVNECPSIKARIVIDGTRSGWVAYHERMDAAVEEFTTVASRADEEAMCYFTSGTTGYPKMCMHAHSYPLGHQTTGKYWLDVRADDLHWNISDTGWAKAAWSSYFGPWLCGAGLFVHHSAGFNAAATLALLQKYPVTTMCAAPTIYRMLVQEDLTKYSYASLRHCVGAGEPLNPEIIQTWRKATGITIRDGYGQTETTILCGSFPCIEARPGSMGRPAPGIDLNIVDNDGRVVAANTEGDIAVRVKPKRPQGLFKEYKGEPEKTAATYKGDWYLTGDRGYVDEDGYFWFVSRADDVILSAGYRIGPFEVESALIQHPAVVESAVVSSPDETRGAVVKAFVVLAPDYKADEGLKKALQEHVKKVTAPYKYPRKLEFVAALPKTVSGKIRRIELREREWQ